MWTEKATNEKSLISIRYVPSKTTKKRKNGAESTIVADERVSLETLGKQDSAFVVFTRPLRKEKAKTVRACRGNRHCVFSPNSAPRMMSGAPHCLVFCLHRAGPRFREGGSRLIE